MSEIASKTTINYYDDNASDYIASTLNVDFSEMQQLFLEKLHEGAFILDFGCGTGRDTKAFLEMKFNVDAIDGSESMCEIAGKYTGINIKHMYFQDLKEVNKYDGIWACASILHLNHEELMNVLKQMAKALKDKGIIYTSFKYGTFEGERNGRYFTDMTEASFAEMMKQIPEFEIEDKWVTMDVREDRENEKWLNLILRKI